jgi:hypothetical protein
MRAFVPYGVMRKHVIVNLLCRQPRQSGTRALDCTPRKSSEMACTARLCSFSTAVAVLLRATGLCFK